MRGRAVKPVSQDTRRARARLAGAMGALLLIGGLEGVEVFRQRRRGVIRSLVTSNKDRDPVSCRLLTLTWWPAGVAAVIAAARLPGFDIAQGRSRVFLTAGLVVTGMGVVVRQWAIATLGRFFVGHVLVQPDQTLVDSGPYRWLRHPSYTGFWLEIVGVGIALGNGVSVALCGLLPLIGIFARIVGEERELNANLSGYAEYVQRKPRLIPFVW
jgi:protein-S-isoprenylcysteine O-methyltransferase Ste14